MPRASKTDALLAIDSPEAEIRQIDLDSYTVTFNTFKTDSDPAPLFHGLPDDACQCPHWGIVLTGKLVFRYADREETYAAGDAYYGPPGHVPLSSPDTQTIEFSPGAELRATMAVVGGTCNGSPNRAQ
ncbi:MAG: cupin domain-containing protein, partial [Chloroflexi bacterium]|nr:cupin domain-containing protein [Chloroflexota bacterium]